MDRYNLIPNGSFEEPQLTTCDVNGDGNVGQLDDWDVLSKTPDVNWIGCQSIDWSVPSGEGRQYVFLRAWPTIREGITVRLKQPLVVGQRYGFSFLAITRKALGQGAGRLRIYLSENPMTSSNYTQGKMIWGDVKDGKLREKAKKWHRYETTFLADKAYEYIAIQNDEEAYEDDAQSVAIDDLHLFLAGTCPGNLVPNGDLEAKLSTGASGSTPYWNEIIGQYGNQYHRSPADDDIQVMDAPHSGTGWFTLRSFYNATLVNSAIGIRLTEPLIPGRTYRVSFYAATKNTTFHHKGEVRVVAAVDSIVWDWNDDDRLTGTNIMDDTRIDGDEEEWHYVEHDFVPSAAYTYIAIQARSGYHVDIDDICLSSDPTQPGRIQFAEPDYDVTESMGPATITLERVDGWAGSVSVTLKTLSSGGSATPGADYTAVATVVTFDQGVTMMSVPVTILDDFLKEGNETVALTLSNATNGATIGRAGTTLNIIDDLTGKRLATATIQEENILRRGKIVWASNKTAGGTVGSSDQLYYNAARSTSPPVLIPGTMGGRDPVWSHDGRYIAYVARVTRTGPTGANVTGDVLKIIDQQGNIYAEYFAPTLLGFNYLGAPEWSRDGIRIAVPYYNTWPNTGIVTLNFSAAYSFATPGTTIVLNKTFGFAALDPVFTPGGGSIYFHGNISHADYPQHSSLFELNLSLPGVMPNVLSGNGSLIEQAFTPSLDRSGTRLIFGSAAWKQDVYDIFEDDEILSFDLVSGLVTRSTAESEHDLGSFAKGPLAYDQFVRQNNIDGSRNQLWLQRRGLVLPFNTADPNNAFNDHAPDWVIPRVDIWDLAGIYNAGTRAASVVWKDIIVDATEPRVFTVQRSLNRTVWTTIGTLQRTGVELVETGYAFLDAAAGDLHMPQVFYRIGLTDETDPSGFAWSLPVEVIIGASGPDLE